LHNYGIARIYSPDDGRKMGLEGMIEDVINSLLPVDSGGGGDWRKSDYWQAPKNWNGKLPLDEVKDIRRIARAITLAECGLNEDENVFKTLPPKQLEENSSVLHKVSPHRGDGRGAVLGITGTGGAGKSSVTDEIVRRFLNAYTNKTIAVISVDPSRKKNRRCFVGR